MSCDIGVRCKDCNEASCFGVRDCYTYELPKILKLASEIKALKEADTEKVLDIKFENIYGGYDCFCDGDEKCCHPLDFVAKHAGHQMLVCDEYGHDYDEKGKRIKELVQ